MKNYPVGKELKGYLCISTIIFELAHIQTNDKKKQQNKQ